MQQVIKESSEVYYASVPLATVGDDEIAFLKERAAENPRLRCRLCLHPSPDASQHEMLIVHHRSCYVRPHRHTRNGETLVVIEGEALGFTFDDRGGVEEAMRLSTPGSGGRFSYIMPAGVWHGMVILSEWLVFVETAPGPFEREATAFPAWAPDGSDEEAAAAYASGLAAQAPAA
jgi:cupin fold WbuC family metalloprotein